MQYTVKLDVFEGPLDLLLHLVETREVDILQVSLAQIAEQYLEIIARQPPADLAMAGEYLVMAATLLRIKVQSLLPAPETEEPEEEEDEGVDPAEELTRRLLEYRIFKEVAQQLEALRARRAACFSRGQGEGEAPGGEEAAAAEGEGGLKEVDVVALAQAFRALLRRRSPAVPTQALPQRRFTVAEGARRILRQLRASRGRISFDQLFSDDDDRGVWIAIFLALLELVRRGRAAVEQEVPFSTIWVQSV